MKNLIGILLVLFTTNAVAADKVVVVPLMGDTTNYLVEPASLVDVFADLVSSAPVIAYTVPNDKHFVLTDMIGHSYGELYIRENDTLKLRIGLEGYNASSYRPPHYTLGSGLTFSPGSNVKVNENGALIGETPVYGHVTLTGYLY